MITTNLIWRSVFPVDPKGIIVALNMSIVYSKGVGLGRGLGLGVMRCTWTVVDWSYILGMGLGRRSCRHTTTGTF